MPKPIHLGRRPAFRFSLVPRLRYARWRRHGTPYVPATRRGLRFFGRPGHGRRAVWIGGGLLRLYRRTRARVRA